MQFIIFVLIYYMKSYNDFYKPAFNFYPLEHFILWN